MARVRWAVQCRARAKSTGRRCRRYSIEGGYLCWVHLGATAQMRAAAARRLAVWKAERGLVRKLGRPLTALEFAYLSGNMPAYRREVRSQLAQLRTDAQEALIRLRNSLET